MTHCTLENIKREWQKKFWSTDLKTKVQNLRDCDINTELRSFTQVVLLQWLFSITFTNIPVSYKE